MAVNSDAFNAVIEDLANTRAEIEALKAENEALRQDAERYRWLRVLGNLTLVDVLINEDGANNLDQAIDQARQKGE